MSRDSQKSKVYAAEKSVQGFLTAGRMETVPELQEYADEVTRSEWFRLRFPRLSPAKPGGPIVTIRDGRGARHPFAFAYARTITLPRFARSRRMLLHEMAHVCVLYEMWSSRVDYASHGWQFCAIYLELVRQFDGQETHDAMVQAFRDHRVTFSGVHPLLAVGA